MFVFGVDVQFVHIESNFHKDGMSQRTKHQWTFVKVEMFSGRSVGGRSVHAPGSCVNGTKNLCLHMKY
jgi:hypothetical protein